MRSLLVLTILLALCFLPNSSEAQSCSASETFDGGFDEVWQISDPTAVRAEGDVLVIEFTGPGNRDEYAVLDACVYTSLAIHVDMRDLNDTHGKTVGFLRNSTSSSPAEATLSSARTDRQSSTMSIPIRPMRKDG
jgi:hypothetical protein